MAKEYKITADSIPDLDEWGWDDYWDINDWMEWHRLMKARYGLAKANSTFLKYWDKQTSGANPLGARSFNSKFKEYARANGFYDGLFSGLLDMLARPGSAAQDLVKGGTNVISSAAKGAENTGKVLKFLIPAAIVVAVVIGGIWAYKTYGNGK